MTRTHNVLAGSLAALGSIVLGLLALTSGIQTAFYLVTFNLVELTIHGIFFVVSGVGTITLLGYAERYLSFEFSNRPLDVYKRTLRNFNQTE